MKVVEKETKNKQGSWLEQPERVWKEMPKYPFEEPWEGGNPSSGKKWYGDYQDVKYWRYLKNEQIPHKAIERILKTPNPIFVVAGLLEGGRERIALTIAQIALKHGFVDKVATNLKTDKFEQIISLEKLEKWILTETEKSKLYILAGADRHLNNSNKNSTLNRKFLDVARLARDTRNHIFLIGFECPLEEHEEEGFRGPVEIDERLFVEWGGKREWKEKNISGSRWIRYKWDYSALFGGWIDTPSAYAHHYINQCLGHRKDVAFYIDVTHLGHPSTMQTGFVRGIEQLQVKYSEHDPAVFYELEPRGGKDKPDGKGSSSLYIEQFLKFDGAHTKAAKNMGLGADTFRRRLIQDLRRALR